MSNGNNGNGDLRLIEDYLPIEAISKEASREKSVRRGHISTLHLWWARRPLVACRAAVYGALVPADRWVQEISVKNGDGKNVEAFKNGTKKGLNRKHAKEFVTKLCRYPKTDPTKAEDIKIKRETEAAIAEAQKHILHAHAERLTKELADANKVAKTPAWVEEFKFNGERVTYDDIIAGRAPRPRVLDMFAGGGAIPLEALRLGCEAYALDLNPVAHIIQLCTLVYPQKYGKPDPNARGMTGPENANGETTWGGLAEEVRYWGNWVLDRVRKEIGDLYPLIPDPEHKKPSRKDAKAAARIGASGKQLAINGDEEDEVVAVDVPEGYLLPIAYLWTRTVRCKNPSCGAAVPLAGQTWLCKKDHRVVALEMKTPRGAKAVDFALRTADSEDELGFDPSDFSSGGNATCRFCGTVADSEYVKAEGCAQRMARQLIATVCVRPGSKGKIYLDADSTNDGNIDEHAEETIRRLLQRTGITVPDEPIITDAKNSNWIRLYGFLTFGQLFTPRQLACLLAFSSAVRELQTVLPSHGIDAARTKALRTLLAAFVDRIADYNSNCCIWEAGGEFIKSTFSQKGLPMMWDFVELAPFGGASGSPAGAIGWITAVIKAEGFAAEGGRVSRGSALSMPYDTASLDVVVTDPPYYDNVPYADISDYFYVWLKRSVGDLYPEHFAATGTPKKGEAVADGTRHGNDRAKAERAYEEMMRGAFAEASRALKPSGQMTVVYAHKTTLGWSTLVDALRRAGFIVSEAWPLDTERPGRVRAIDSAALASSIFLVARKRAVAAGIGNYEDDVQPELQQIVRERVETLWELGIAGADLVIACVGAGLRAFTKYEKVEYANGEEVPAEKFLAEVEGVVLDTMMGKLFGQSGTSVSAIDAASRFYVLWRFVYKVAEIDSGEAIVFTYAQHVELDGPNGLSDGKDALVEKKKAKYRARDFTERGKYEKLGLPRDSGEAAPLIDVLHRVLWLMENAPRKLGEFLDDARPDRERLRVLAQSLAGAALSGKTEEEAEKLVSTTPAEQAALGKLLANWRGLIESRLAAGEGGLFGSKK
jgi:putative DNA methylase